jgi:hypothetical protein
LATTGGVSKMRGLRYGEFDRIAWVTMKNEGPVIANILLDGIYPENMRMPVTPEDSSIRYNQRQTYPVRGSVFLDGAAVAGAKVIFYAAEKGGKQTYVGDAFSEADGTFVISSHQANDGAPAGDYAVVVMLREPEVDAAGNSGPNRLPAKYATPQTTDLKVQVKAGPNDFVLHMSK